MWEISPRVNSPKNDDPLLWEPVHAEPKQTKTDALELLCETHFTRAFRPLGGYEPRSERLYPALLTTLIAHGTNLGIAGMGQSAQGITVDMLQHVTRWFLREDTIKAANAALVNFHHQLPISRVWGEGIASSSDGQRFGIQQSSLLASYYPRYFGYYERAATVYTHTSDQYSVFGTRIISCSPREALYVLDGLLENNTILRLREHYTDTHGFTEHIFGLCYLLGYSFMPRLRSRTGPRQPMSSFSGLRTHPRRTGSLELSPRSAAL
jgi:hypothetical protein